MSRPTEAERLRRRRRVLRRTTAMALSLVALGLLVRYGLHREWGQLVLLAGLATNLVGLAAAPLLHPRPLPRGR